LPLKLYRRITLAMSVHRRVSKIGGSLGVIIPRDLAESMGVEEGTPVSITMVGRQMVVEPEDDTLPAATFRRAYAAVLRRHGPAFQKLADFDRSNEAKPPARRRRGQ